jgi:hypothetical protein
MDAKDSEWRNIPGLPGEWRTGRAETPKQPRDVRDAIWEPITGQAARTNMKAKATAAIKAADHGTVKILGSMLRSARAYAKRIEDEAGKQ